MKKNKKENVKILYNKTNSDNYTFIINEDIISQQSSITYLKSENENNGEEQDMIGKKEENYKKKKVMSKSENANSIRGLKFANPSQRNHSSIYE
jgi:hypothetical protein